MEQSFCALFRNIGQKFDQELHEIKHGSLRPPPVGKPSKDEVNEIPGDYEFEVILGLAEGSSGTLYLVSDRKTKIEYAMKNLVLADKEISKSLSRGISILWGLEHDNIVKLHRVFCYSGCVKLVMEFVPDSLFGRMRLDPFFFEPSLIKDWLKQILHALTYLHKKDIIHRDLIPSNILIDDGDNLKLAIQSCFGLARAVDGNVTPQVTTIFYGAPELLLGSHSYTTAIDIWAVGCIFVELLTSQPFVPPPTGILTSKSKSIDAQVKAIFRKFGTPSEDDWPGVSSLPNFPRRLPVFPREAFVAENADACAIDLMSRLLCLNPKKRITAEAALMHPYLVKQVGVSMEE